MGVKAGCPLRIDDNGDLILHTADGDICLHKPRIYQEVNGVKQPISGHYVLLGPETPDSRPSAQQVGFQVAAYDTSRPLIIDPVLSYSTYLGGSGSDSGWSITVDSLGNAYVTGVTQSSNFPTASPLQAAYGGGTSDAFVAKLNPTGSALIYSTYLGGNSIDEGRGITVDSSGNAYVTGRTDSADFPTVNPFQSTRGGSSDADAFVVKVDAAGSALVYSTYLGGNSSDEGRGITVDSSGNAYVTGYTFSTNFPTTVGAFQTALAGVGTYDAFVAKLNAAGFALVYSTYLGGSGGDLGYGIAVDSSGNAHVTGATSGDFPTVNPFQATGGGDAFVTKIASTGGVSADLSTTKIDSPDPVMIGNNLTYTVTVTNNGPDATTGIVVTDTLPAGVILVSSSASQGACSSGANTVTCNLGSLANGALATVTIVMTPTVVGEISNTATVVGNGTDPSIANNTATVVTTVVSNSDLSVTKTDCPDPVTVGSNLTYTVTVINSGPDTATGVTLTDTLPGGVSFVLATPTQGVCIGTSTIACDLGSLANGTSAKVTIVVTPTAAGTLSNTTSVAGNETDPNTANNTATAVTTVTTASTDTDGGIPDSQDNCPAVANPEQGDYDGDGITDFAVIREIGDQLQWLIDTNKDGVTNIEVNYGLITDESVPADYDGDGITDLAVIRALDNGQLQWLVDTNKDGVTDIEINYGLTTDEPVPADYDGDGITDFAVVRGVFGSGKVWQLQWIIDTNRDSVADIKVNYGLITDEPIPSDYDGGGVTDLAVLRGVALQWQWIIDTNKDGVTDIRINYGLRTDEPAPADYDGDSITDLAVLRALKKSGQLQWIIDTNKDGVADIRVNYGLITDKPLPADYNGDHITDLAIIRALDNGQLQWIIDTNKDGVADIRVNYGLTTDEPIT